MLDTLLLDAKDATPLFSIETVANQTALYRAVAATNGQSLSHVAAVQWPASKQKLSKKEKDASVFIHGLTIPSSVFLKNSLLGGSRKFHIPGQNNALKWKHVGAHWECTLCSHACTTHRAVATFEPAHTTSAARLAIYTESVLSSKSDNRLHEQYNGVDMNMLAYLVLSSLLLITPLHAWHTLHKPAPIQHQSEKVSHPRNHRLHVLTPTITTSSPSKSPRLDLLGDDHLPPAHSPLRGSPASSGFSSLPPSPLTPSMDLSPIHHDTFASSSSNGNCPVSTSTVFRRNSNRLPSPLITCSTFTTSSCSSSSPTSASPSTPITSTPAGPRAITPYHLPPAPSHTPTTPSTPHPHHSHSLPPSSYHSHPHHRSHTNNALHLETTHGVAPIPYTTQMYNIQFANDAVEPRNEPVSDDELPPAYNEIEWTVRVKQPRRGGNAQLRLHTAPVTQ